MNINPNSVQKSITGSIDGVFNDIDILHDATIDRDALIKGNLTVLGTINGGGGGGGGEDRGFYNATDSENQFRSSNDIDIKSTGSTNVTVRLKNQNNVTTNSKLETGTIQLTGNDNLFTFTNSTLTINCTAFDQPTIRFNNQNNESTNTQIYCGKIIVGTLPQFLAVSDEIVFQSSTSSEPKFYFRNAGSDSTTSQVYLGKLFYGTIEGGEIIAVEVETPSLLSQSIINANLTGNALITTQRLKSFCVDETDIANTTVNATNISAVTVNATNVSGNTVSGGAGNFTTSTIGVLDAGDVNGLVGIFATSLTVGADPLANCVISGLTGNINCSSLNIVVAEVSVCTLSSLGIITCVGVVATANISASSLNAGPCNFGTINVSGNTIISGVLQVDNPTESNSPLIGCATFLGGVGIGKTLSCGGAVRLTDTTPSTNIFSILNPSPSISPSTGAFTCAGGVGIGGDLFVQGDINTNSNFVVSNVTATTASLGTLTITNTTPSTNVFLVQNESESISVGTGSAVFLGGISISKNCWLGGTFFAQQIFCTGVTTQGITIDNIVAPNVLYINNPTDSSSVGSGAVVIEGGLGVGKNIQAGGTVFSPNVTTGNIFIDNNIPASTVLYINNPTPATSELTGALRCEGGAAFVQECYFGNHIFVGGNIDAEGIQGTSLSINGPMTFSTLVISDTTPSTNVFLVQNESDSISPITGSGVFLGGVGIAKNVNVGGNCNVAGTVVFSNTNPGTNVLNISNTSNSISPSTGAFVCAGGVGIGGDLYVGGSIYGGINPIANTFTFNIYRGVPASPGFVQPLPVGISVDYQFAKYIKIGKMVVAFYSLNMTVLNPVMAQGDGYYVTTPPLCDWSNNYFPYELAAPTNPGNTALEGTTSPVFVSNSIETVVGVGIPQKFFMVFSNTPLFAPANQKFQFTMTYFID